MSPGPRPRRSAPSATFRTRGVVVRRTEYRDVDLIVALFTEELGLVSALARGARKSQKRFGGAIEPFHTLGLRLEERAGQDLLTLDEATIDVVRPRLVSELGRLEAAGRALAWVRRAAPPRTPEPRVWRSVEAVLASLDAEETTAPLAHAAAFGFSLIAALGWGLELDRCVRCGKPCGPRQPAALDAVRGGLVCSACGGDRKKMSAAQRARLRAASAGDGAALAPDDVPVALDLVDRVLDAHSGTRA